MNQYIKTWVGTVILIIIILTGGAFLWVTQRSRAVDESVPVNNVVVVKKQTRALTPFLAPITDETAGWQMYRNDKFGFQFDYLSASAFDTAKLKIDSWECGIDNLKETCVTLNLPTTDKSFLPTWPNPTKDEIAKAMNYEVLRVQIITKSDLDKVLKRCADTAFADLSWCKPGQIHAGNKFYPSPDGNKIYFFDNNSGMPAIQDTPYPNDGIPWSALGNFKII